MEDPVLGEEVEDVTEATVETVEERYVPHVQEPIQPLSTGEYVWYSALNYFSNPWAFLIFLYLLYRVYRWVGPRLTSPLVERWEDWQARREQAEEAALYKKDPDVYQAKMEALEAARLRMQASYDQDAEVERVKREEKEEARREQDIQDWELHQRGGGYKNRLPPKVDKEREALEQQARLKGKKGYPKQAPPSDFNPLMGGGAGGSGYRAPARRGAAGGG